MIKLIATDMDGTLLNAAHEISKKILTRLNMLNQRDYSSHCNGSCIL